jgi:hypothetical protein
MNHLLSSFNHYAGVPDGGDFERTLFGGKGLDGTARYSQCDCRQGEQQGKQFHDSLLSVDMRM